tara:strand:+ start:2358 stop:2657 length:300 start_codon:yes stop_codon:yes gene_type:complete
MKGFLIKFNERVLLLNDDYIEIVFKLAPSGHKGRIRLKIINALHDFNKSIYISDEKEFAKIKTLYQSDNELVKTMWDTFKNKENEQERMDRIKNISKII